MREDVERDQEAWNPGGDGACRDTHPETNGHKDTRRGLRGAGGKETHTEVRAQEARDRERERPEGSRGAEAGCPQRGKEGAPDTLSLQHRYGGPRA